jgi:conjugative transposon TraJ protein
MKWYSKIALLLTLVGLNIPAHAQGVAGNISKMQTVLDNLYTEMMPLCSGLMGIGRGIAGFAALFYIASRVWRHLANAEPIDFYPLFRPFVLGFCISIFPSILGLINGVMQPTVTATASMVKDSDKSIAILLKLKEEAIKKTDAWKMYVGENGEGDKEKYTKYIFHVKENEDLSVTQKLFAPDIAFTLAKAEYRIKNSVKEWLSTLLEILFQAAALAINTIRTFQLVVLSILGPLVFGLAVFDGFSHTLTAWLAKYINIFLWLPVANIFGAIIGKIEVGMLKLDLSQIGSTGDTMFSSTDAGYLIFMIIAIVGYFTVPTVAGFVVNAGGANAIVQKATSMMSSAGGMAMGAATGGVATAASMGKVAVDALSSSGGDKGGSSGGSGSSGNNYQANQLKGNS